ncbi:catecholate siderophore receptor Fiu [Herbaspirillum sp. AP21]|uniref:catecholate siderophore receptor Fiu n=1 Tax=Herbaspirillum sp. AP21 TaxID=2754073 RepID=UPI0015DA5B59|nr:catecholate siderophore receptor Fiu [Herbaspirillum sp. AP21]NZD70295.1 catecholate siderophore receptor Fiu [Herbaspirillum sp. AP21]
MSLIKSRKHPTPTPTRLRAAVAGALLLPAVAAHAQAGGSQLPGLQVDAVRESPYKAERSASPKYTQPLVDTPQTLQIIKRPLMEQQGATSLTEALRNTPGVGTFFLGENGSTSTGDTVYMRGFDASGAIFVDNVRDLGAISRDVFNLQQVEVLKGPAGTDNGRGSPTGSINLITKQPELADAVSASATYGSWNQKRATVDWNRVLDNDRGLALRLNVMKQNSGVPGRHEVHSSRDGIAPSLAWGLNGPTRIFLNYLHMQQDNRPDGGVSTIGLPGYSSPDPARPFLSQAPKVNPRNFYGHIDDYDRVNADMYTLRVEHDFSPRLKLQNSTRYARTDQDYRLSSFLATGAKSSRFDTGLKTPSINDRSTWLLGRQLINRRDQANHILSNQTHVSTELATGPLQHTLVGGLELSSERQDALSFTASGGPRPDANLYAPDPRFDDSKLRINVSGRNKGETDTASLYLLDTVKFDERFSVTVGLREDHYRTRFFNLNQNGPSELKTSGKLLNWKLAGVFKPTRNSSLYALMATSQQPPGGANFNLSASKDSASNPDYAPQKTRTAEVGSKWEILDRKLLLTAALFRTEVSNEIEKDEQSGVFFQTGKKRNQGVELGVSGELTPNLSVTAGYSRMHSSVESGKIVTASGENILNYTPRQSFTSWASWRLPQGFVVGGGLRYSGGLQRGRDGAIGTPTGTEAYLVADAMAGYAINKTVDLQFNVTNLFNKDYAASINKSGYRYTPGAPRAFALTGNFKF